MATSLISLKNPSLSSRTVEALTDYIIKELRPGELCPTEQALCDRLKIGRSTLREALKVLESRGLIERQQGVGVRVVDGSRQAAVEMLHLLFRRGEASAGDLLEVRKLYEVQAAALAAERATPADLRTIQSALESMRSPQTTHNEYVEGDFQFHFAIARATHNRVLALIVETIRPLLRNEILSTLQIDPRPELRHRYHERIYDAIARKDGRQAAAAMDEHLCATEEMLRQSPVPGTPERPGVGETP